MDSVQVDSKAVIEVVSRNLIKARQEAGLSIREVEELTGINKSTISRLESKEREPKISTYLKLMTLYKEKKKERLI